MADVKYFADLTPLAVLDGAKIIAVQNDPTGSFGYKVTLDQLSDFAVTTKTYSSLTTTAKTVDGAINEVNANIPVTVINSSNPSNTYYFAGLVIDSPGKTAFTISTAPINNEAFRLYLNGQLIPETEYTLVGTSLTWSGVSLIVPPTPGDPDEFTAIINDSGVPTSPVDSVFGRTGAILAATSDYDASQVDNDSSVTGATVKDALDTLDGQSGVSSVFGRTGTVTAATSDYDASQIDNDSAVSGATVDAALDFVNTKEVIVSKGFGDSPYAANAGEVVFANTSGGAVSIVLPAASTNAGARIRVNKVTSDTNAVTINTTGGDTVGFQSSWSLSNQGDGTTAISDGVSEWCLVTERHATGFAYFLPDHDANQGSHRVQNIAGSGNANFEFRLPNDFLSIISLEIELTPSAGAALSGRDIDLTSDYYTQGEVWNIHSETDTGTTYDFSGLTNTGTSIDLAPVFTNGAANDICGVNIDQNAVGGVVSYYGIPLTYRKKG